MTFGYVGPAFSASGAISRRNTPQSDCVSPGLYGTDRKRFGHFRPWGVVTPKKRRPVKFHLAGRLSRMSKALPKGGSALCYAQDYERPADRRDRPSPKLERRRFNGFKDRAPRRKFESVSSAAESARATMAR